MANIIGTSWGETPTTLGDPGGVVTWSIASGGNGITRFGGTSGMSVNGESFLTFDFTQVIRDAFADWSGAGDLEFMQVKDSGGAAGSSSFPDIRIFFGAIPSDTIGLAFFPTSTPSAIAGDILFDTLALFNTDRALFKGLVLHEIGHALGLGHVANNAIMTPTILFEALKSDDKNGIRQIYGRQDDKRPIYDLPDERKNLAILNAPSGIKVNGNGENNRIEGADGKEFLSGRSGDDQLFGRGGNDALDGGRGHDTLSGGQGDDTLLGEMGKDELEGGEGVDRLIGQHGDDTLHGNGGNDRISGGDDDDRLNGNGGADALEGGAGNDRINGGNGNDDLEGKDGRDTLIGGAGADVLSGQSDADKLSGKGGDDRLMGGSGDDTGEGGAGRDVLQGKAGQDRLKGGVGADVLNGQAGDDKLQGDAGNDTVFGSVGNDTLRGNGGGDRLDGGKGNDSLDGGNGDDAFVFAGMHGQDTIGDFNARDSGEKVNLRGVASISDMGDLRAAASRQGNDVLIDTGRGNSILLEDVNLRDLDAGDFLF